MNWAAKRSDLVIEKMKLDKFFSMYLEKFERKMDPEKTNTPIWNLYKKKLKEYDEINRNIRACDYWLSKSV